MKVIAFNPDISQDERTFLSRRLAAGATVLNVKNSDRMEVGERILVGEMSRERSEIVEVASKTPTTITLAEATVFPHDADDPVTLLQYDQIRFYRSTAGELGPFSLLHTTDVDVDNADGKTYYDDVNALDDYWYQIAYYDSVHDEESERSASIQSTGYEDGSAGRLILDIAEQVNDKEFLTWSINTYLAVMNDISDDLITQAKRPYRFLKRLALLDVELGGTTAPYPDNLWKIDYVEANIANPVSVEVIRPKVVSAGDMRFRQSQTPLPSDMVYEVAFDDETNSLLFNPPARTMRLGAFRLHYYKFFNRFKTMSDKVETPNALVYKWGLLRDYYLAKADEDSKYVTKSSMYDQRYQAEVMKLQREKQIVADAPRQMGPPIRRYRQ